MIQIIKKDLKGIPPIGLWNLLLSYVVAISLTVIFFVCWSFKELYFFLSLMYGISFLRLKHANLPIKRNSVVIMWCILCFGLSGILMQLLELYEWSFLGVLFSGFIMMSLYSYASIWSYYLRYNEEKEGYDFDCYDRLVKTKENGQLFSVILFCIALFSSAIVDSNTKAEQEDQKLNQQLTQEVFVPVKLVKEEMYDGHTVYILEAKGQRFKVSPFDYPEVRDINSNSQVRVILGDKDGHHLRTVKKIQFKN